jgi:CRP/FNR family transcriptional regulator, cyclic AMP receptor protein
MISVDVLRKFKIFQELNDRELEIVASLAQKKAFKSGVRIFEEKALADRFYLINEGKVAIKLSSSEIELQIDEIGAGESFGWSAVIDPQSFTAGAWALTDTEILFFESDHLLDLFRKNNHIGYRVIKEVAKVVSKRLKAFEARFVQCEGEKKK